MPDMTATNDSPAEGASTSLLGLSKVVDQLRERAARLRLQAVFALFLLVSLLSGLWLFGYAGQLAIAEVRQTSLLFEERQADLLDKRRTLTSKLSILEEQIRVAKSASERRALEAELNDLKSEEMFLARQLASLSERQTNTKTQGTEQLISVLTTRIGSVLLLLFLVQILVTLYRYSARLAAYYDARADALVLAPSFQSLSFPDLVSCFSPERLDFGRTPNTPLQHAIELAKELSTVKNRG